MHHQAVRAQDSWLVASPGTKQTWQMHATRGHMHCQASSLTPAGSPTRVGVPEAALDVSLLGDEGHRREAVAGLRAHANQDEGPSSGQRLHASLCNTAGLVPRMRLCELGPAVDRGYTHTVEDPNDSAGWHLP